MNKLTVAFLSLFVAFSAGVGNAPVFADPIGTVATAIAAATLLKPALN